jgi:hypothetical protein
MIGASDGPRFMPGAGRKAGETISVEPPIDAETNAFQTT